MRKFKIILAFVMLANLFTALPSHAAEKYDSAAFAGAFGVHIEKDKAVTRGEFAKMLAIAARLDGAKYSSSVFTDVSGSEYISYIEALRGAGITNGYGDTFEPDRQIALSEAAAMASRALGYDGALTKSEYTATCAELSKGLNEELDGAGAEKIICRMLTHDMVYKKAASNGGYTIENDCTMLEAVWDAEEIKGVVEANKYTHIYNKDITTEGIIIGGKTYTDLSGEAERLLGENVVGYVNEDGEILFAYAEKNNEIIIDADDVDSCSDFRLDYTADSGSKKAMLSKKFTVIKNGRVSDYSENFLPKYGSVRLIDNDNDKKYDVVFVESYTFGILDGVSAARELIYDSVDKSALKDYSDAPDKYYTYYRPSEEGVMTECGVDELEKGDSLRIAASDDGRIVTVYAAPSSVSGKYTGYDEDYIYIDGAKYKTTDYFEKYARSVIITGNEYLFYLSDDGRLVDIDRGSDAYKYAYVYKAYENTDEDAEINVKLLDTSGIVTYKLSKNVYLDGVKKKNTDSSVKSALMNADGSQKLQLIRFGTDKSGLISMIDTLSYNTAPKPYEDPDNERDSLYRNFAYSDKNQKLTYKIENQYLYYSSVIVGKITAGTTVIQIPDTSSGGEIKEKDFSIGSAASFTNDSSYIADVYDVDELGRIGCVVICAQASSDFDNAVNNYKNNAFGVVDSVTVALNDDGEAVTKLYYWSGGAFKESILTSDAVNHFDASGADDGNKLSVGDVFTFKTNNSGEIEMYRIYYDFSEKKEVYNITDAVYLVNMGHLSARSGADAMFIRENMADSKVPITLAANYAVVEADGHVSQGDLSDVISAKSAGGEASRIFVWAKYTRASICIIFKD